jgi:hypothetical protein
MTDKLDLTPVPSVLTPQQQANYERDERIAIQLECHYSLMHSATKSPTTDKPSTTSKAPPAHSTPGSSSTKPNPT